MARFSVIATMTACLVLSGCASTGSGPTYADAASGAALQGDKWRVEDVGGGGVIDNSRAMLLFAESGRLSGNTSCNHLIASYTVEGSKLTISSAGTTTRVCVPALMDLERKLLNLLGAVTHYAIDPTGALILTSASGQQIVARR